MATGYSFAMTAANTTQDKPRAMIHWRLFAMVYDALPVIALWMLASAAFTVGYTFLGHHGARENIAPFSLLQVLLWAVCWLITGLYATVSWRRGGQTLGMRPWRIKVVNNDGSPPSLRALWIRYAVSTLSFAAAGVGFWWAWIDRDRRTWHDRASGTRLIRMPKRR